MKKALHWIIIVVACLSMLASLAGCKQATTEAPVVTTAPVVPPVTTAEPTKPPEVVPTAIPPTDVPAPAEEIVLSFYNWWVGAEPFTKMGAIQMEEFNTLHQGACKIEEVGIPNYPDFLVAVKADVASGNIPAVFMQSENVQDVAGTWLDGILADLTPYIDEEFLSFKSKSVWDLTTQNGKIVGVHYGDLVTGLYYNKEMFAKAGVEVPLKTWDDFFAAGDKLIASGVYPIALENLEGWVPMLMFTAYVGGYGGPDILVGLKDFNNPAFLEAAKFLLKLKDYATPDSLGAGYQIAANNFMGEKAAMIANGPWMISDMKKIEEFFPKVDIMGFPGYTADKSPLMTSGPGMKIGAGIQLQDNPTAMECAVAYLKYISEPDNVKRMVIDSGTIIRSNNVDYSDVPNMEPLTVKFINLLDIESAYTVPNIRDQVGHGFDVAFREEIGNLWSGSITPEQFITNLNKKVFNK